MTALVDSAACPRCGAPRVDAPECPSCGVIYAKARPRLATVPPEQAEGPPPAAAAVVEGAYSPPPPAVWRLDAEQVQHERRFRIFAIPVALLLAFAISKTGFGHAVARIFASMWIHELGHAVAAWLSGHFALPGPWRTMVGDERSLLTIVLVAGALIALGVNAWRRERTGWLVAAALLLGLQLFCTGVLSRPAVRAFVTFFGDGGCFVLGALLMLTFYAPPDSRLHKGWLRWGFLVIGAIAFMDAADTWWGALSDVDKIPFGEIEGVGFSDPQKLVETHGWSVTELVRRYVAVSALSLTAVAVGYVLGLFAPIQPPSTPLGDE